MNPRLTISVCTFQSGDFDVMLIDEETGEQVCFSGNQKITDEQLDIVNRLAPACVWTTYCPSEQYKALQDRCDELEAAAKTMLAHLVAAVSVIERSEESGYDPSCAYGSDTMYQMAMKDFDRCIEAGRKALRSVVDGGE